VGTVPQIVGTGNSHKILIGKLLGEFLKCKRDFMADVRILKADVGYRDANSAPVSTEDVSVVKKCQILYSSVTLGFC
jgi:hypothetical protein